MSDNNNPPPVLKNVEYIDPPNELKNIVGDGGISKNKLQQANNLIKDNEIDFAPFAQTHIDRVDAYLKKISAAEAPPQKMKFFKEILHDIMQLKAHGGMFNYPVISSISKISLDALADLDTVNNDVYDLITVHNKIIRLVIQNKIKQNDTPEAKGLIAELNNAFLRYNAKHQTS